MRCLHKAYQFLCLLLFFLNFQVNLSLSSSSSITQLCSHDEAAALIQFKSSFSIDETSFLFYDGTCIKSYPKTDSWKEGTDCCSWDGVTCDAIKGHVIGLDLSCSLLSGTITSNSTLFHLPHLQKLNLAFNNFHSSKMSSKFGEFASLKYLDLSETGFVGQVPSQVSHLSKLVSLDLSRNFDLTFDKHTLEGLVHNLTEVRQLFLDGINMSSINPGVLMNLSSSLKSLSLKYCDLRGKFPENIFHLPNLKMLVLGYNENLNLSLPKLNQSSHLKLLDLSHMSFSRQLFNSIGNLVSLERLDASFAIFSRGGLPEPIGNFSSLKHLDLSFSHLSGSIPKSLGKLISLKHLDLSYSTLSGFIPASLGNLISLKNLDLSYSELSGSIPTSLGNLISLKHLDLSYSKLSGSIPRSLGNLSQISYLDLSFNSFSGQIPSTLTNLEQLEFLNIEENQLEGSIPDKVIAFPKLISLDLSGNFLSGTLPSWLYTISSLNSIDLSHNQFSGHIKEFQCNSLEEIDLDNNKLQGPIPSSISQLVNLSRVSLPANNLSGIVEFGMFSKLQNLYYLDLSDNSLSLNFNGTSVDYTLPNLQYLYFSACNVSEFPQFLRDSKRIGILDLSDNKIYGKIPEWMWDAGKDSLGFLNLSHNSLTDIGQLPWTTIEVLDLSSNLIHGNLPIPPLSTSVFMISNNSLSGEIPSLICNVSSLEILDLSHNNLTGIIPQCFGDLSESLLTLNLRVNKFHGIIPPTFTKRCQLMDLNLNGNQLEGPLTRSILNCKSLEVLDVGHNKINGTFPHWLGSLPQLQVLVLRSNQLQGSIHDTRSNLSFSKIQIFDLSSNYFSGTLPVRYITNFKAMINLTKFESVERYMGVNDTFETFYSYSIGIAIKGVEMEVLKIFTKLTSIDFSNNKFQGEIPKVIGKLNSLIGLNLSHNNLNGCIPTSIGNLISLEWLDLSSNRLTGTIPKQLLDVTFLSIFNVSKNQLEGQIPQGKQFNTFGNDSYEGNNGLCGFPVSKGCSNSDPSPAKSLEEDGPKSNVAFGWKVVLTGYGCGVVFGLATGYVVFQTGKPKWFVTLVEDRHHRRRKMSKIGNRNRGGRRIESVQMMFKHFC